MHCALPLSLSLVLAACPGADRATVNEVYYDATGDDSGSEFVELFNPTSHPVLLAGARLEAGDGAGANRWTLRWTAPAGLTLESGARYVIGGALVSPRPDTLIELALQNGPDAVRLVWPDGVTEVVGYGALSSPEYYCGEPAIDVPSGQSLARIPDNAMSGDNSRDFQPRAPGPGSANLLARHVAWIPGSMALLPPQPEPAAQVRLTGRVVNAGTEPVSAGALAIRALLAREAGDEPRADRVVAGGLAPGETLAVEIDALAPEAGVHTWVLTAQLEGEESPPGTRDSLRARTGLGLLELTEIQFHPTHDEGEWIELRNRSREPVALSGWTLRDRSGTRGIARTTLELAPESLAVLVQHRDLMIAAFPVLDTSRVVTLSPWPSLNNSDDSGGIADAVELSDTEALPADHAAYSAAGVPSGVPLDRGSGDKWRAALDPLGTPLASPLKPRSISGSFALLAPRLRAGTASTRVAWALPWSEARIRIDAYDLMGDRVAALLGDTEVAGHGERDLATAALGAGFYVLAFEARPQAGSGSVTATSTLRIEGYAP